MMNNKKMVMWILGGLGAAALTYGLYQLLKGQTPKKKIEFAPIEEKKELKWLAEEKKRKSGEKIEDKKSVADELSIQETQKVYSPSKKEETKDERPKTPSPKTEMEKKEAPKEKPVAPQTPVQLNPNTPTKGVDTANEIKSEYLAVGISTPAKNSQITQSTTPSSDAPSTGSINNPTSSKRRRSSSRRRRRNSQRNAVNLENTKDPEVELLRATKEEVIIPKFCECRENQNGEVKDDEQLFDPKIKYKIEQPKIDVDYYPYQPINLLTPVEGESELCREVWDASTFVARPTSYLTPLQAVLDAQKCAAMQAEVIDKMLKYGDFEEGE